MGPLGDRQRLGLIVGLVGVVVVFAVLFPLRRHFDETFPALILLVPIVVAGGLGGWKVSLLVSCAAAVALALFLPPIGQIRVHLARDVLSIVALFVVGAVVGALVGRRTPVADQPLLDQRRIQLLRSVSHDLRNPLNTIQVAADLLATTGPDADQRSALLGVVADESRRLDRIVGNMLSVSRIEAGAFLPRLEPSHLPSLVDSAVKRFASTHDHPVVIDVPPDLPDVSADPVQIDQVITNLLDNAVLHSPESRPVTVAARPHGDRVEVTVLDEGPGFGTDLVALGPRPFRTEGLGGGIGLGLTVCLGIVDAHGGALVLDNAPSGGARASFTLRVAS